MKILLGVFLAAACLGGSSCTTAKLWEDTDPNDPILLAAGENSEATLKKMGVDYTVIDTPDWKGYSVEKTKLRKAIDLQLRLAGTPPALALDAAGTFLALIACNPDVWCGVLEGIACSVNSR